MVSIDRKKTNVIIVPNLKTNHQKRNSKNYDLHLIRKTEAREQKREDTAKAKTDPNDGKVESTIIEDLNCNLHEEADTKIIYHACSFLDQCNIVNRTSDTDILIIMLANMLKLKNASSHIWMLTGTNNHERFIDITKIYDELGELLASSLSGFLAFTGSDFNLAFFSKGKKRPFGLLKKSVEFQKAFASLGDVDLNEESLFDIIQKFICQMYGAKKSVDVDDGRFQLFVGSYKANDVNENFTKKIRSFDDLLVKPSCGNSF